MKQKFMTISIIILYIYLIAGCGDKLAEVTGVPGKLKVMATAYPVYEFTKIVGGDKIELSMLVPKGIEPHDWEPTAKDLAKIQSTKLFLFHGAGFEPWLEKVTAAGILGEVGTAQVSKNISLLSDTHAHKNIEQQNADENQSNNDPHVWLDPVCAITEVENIAEALVAADGTNAEYYRNNCESVKKALSELNLEYQTVLDKVAHRDFVTSHAAFGYLAKRYNLQQISITGLAPDAEPTLEKMRQVVQFCRDNKIKVVFFETLANSRLAETIARETGAKSMVLSPIEGLNVQEEAEGCDYFGLMRKNLKNLQIALE